MNSFLKVLFTYKQTSGVFMSVCSFLHSLSQCPSNNKSGSNNTVDFGKKIYASTKREDFLFEKLLCWTISRKRLCLKLLVVNGLFLCFGVSF